MMANFLRDSLKMLIGESSHIDELRIGSGEYKNLTVSREMTEQLEFEYTARGQRYRTTFTTSTSHRDVSVLVRLDKRVVSQYLIRSGQVLCIENYLITTEEPQLLVTAIASLIG